MYDADMKFYLTLFCILTSSIYLSGCSNSRFAKQTHAFVNIETGQNKAHLRSLVSLVTNEVEKYCVSLPDKTDYALVARLHCAKELLGRNDLSQQQRNFALSSYNLSLNALVRADKDGLLQNERVLIRYKNLAQFSFASDMIAIDNRLTPTIFGDIGLPISVHRQNKREGLDLYFPLEEVVKDATIVLGNIESVDGLAFELSLNIQHHSDNAHVTIGTNKYEAQRSPGAAYLSLIEKADIDDYNWLGLVSPSEAEKRRGVFAIGDISPHKIPIIMIHGLNSDPLIWRHLTMAILNDANLFAKYQIWHVYYPSGPPPFYSAARTRDNLRNLLKNINSTVLAQKAVVIGHSMGGIVAKLLTTQTSYELWDATFTERPENVVSAENIPVKDIFIFEPVFTNNTVFYLDTPFKGSEIANSVIGQVGAFLVSLPSEFTQLFKDFIDRVGTQILTDKMRPYLINYGPSSIHVLRPGHPLIDALYNLPSNGNSYTIIGSNGMLTCEVELSCSDVSDGVVNYLSANHTQATERIIVKSSHNSFKSEEAIQFILNKLRAE